MSNSNNLTAKTKIRLRKEKSVIDLINKISLEFINSGINEKHIKKALKYYLNSSEVLDDNFAFDLFDGFLTKIEKELWQLALHTEKNFIKELESYSRPPLNHDIVAPEEDIKEELPSKIVTAKTNDLVSNIDVTETFPTPVEMNPILELESFSELEKEVVVPEENIELSSPKETITELTMEEFQIDEETIDEEQNIKLSSPEEAPTGTAMEKFLVDEEVVDVEDFSSDIVDITPNEIVTNDEVKSISNQEEKKAEVQDIIIERKPSIDFKKEKISQTIEKIASQYIGRGVLNKHIIRAKEYYLKLPSLYEDISHDDFELLIRNIESELYTLAENTKNNYIKQLKNTIVANPNLRPADKKKITDNIHLNKEEKGRTVKRLIDYIASKYVGQGVFDRHIKKAYNIFGNKPEIFNDKLSYEDFNKFLSNIEKELYTLAEQTKRNYTKQLEEEKKWAKILKKQ